MKKIIDIILVIAITFTMTGCEKGYFGLTGVLVSGGASNKEYYKGKIPCSYFKRNWDGNRCLQVTGIPFMVIEYDRSDNHIIDFEFGLSGVTQTILDSPSLYEGTMDASIVDCYKKLDLESPVSLPVNWPVTAWNGTVTNGSLNAGGVIFYHTDITGNTKFTFSRMTGQITGGAENLTGDGMETDTMMDFDMFKQ